MPFALRRLLSVFLFALAVAVGGGMAVDGGRGAAPVWVEEGAGFPDELTATHGGAGERFAGLGAGDPEPACAAAGPRLPAAAGGTVRAACPLSPAHPPRAGPPFPTGPPHLA